MVIDFEEMLIIRDENEDQICLTRHNDSSRDYGFSNSSSHVHGSTSTLMDLSAGYLRVFDAFQYKSSVRSIIAICTPTPPVLADVPVAAIESTQEILALQGLGWLVELFSSLDGPTSRPASGYFDASTVVDEKKYRLIGFLYEVINALTEKFETHLGRTYDRSDFVKNFDFCLIYSQMPWLDNFFGNNKPFETTFLNSGSYHFDQRLNSRNDPKELVIPFIGKDLNEGIDRFLEAFELPRNKRLKRIMFSNITKKTGRFHRVPHSFVSNAVELSYKAETLIKTTRCPKGTYQVLEYERRTLQDKLLSYAASLTQIFQIDVACDMLEKVVSKTEFLNTAGYVNNTKLLALLKEFSLPKQKRLMSEEFGIIDGDNSKKSSMDRYLLDTANMFCEFQDKDSIPEKLKDKYPNGIQLPKKFKGAKELHDKLSVVHNEIKMCANNKDIGYRKEELLIDGLTYQNMSLVLPKDTATVSLWGKQLHHCIASYGNGAAKKKLMLLAVMVDGELAYNVELKYSGNKDNKYVLGQFCGNRNCKPTDEHKQSFNKMMKDCSDILNNLVPCYTDQTKPADLSLEQLRERILDFYSSEEQSESEPNFSSNESLQNKNQDQLATQGVQ